MSRLTYMILFLAAYAFLGFSALWAFYLEEYAKAAALAALAAINQANYRDARDQGER